MNKISKQIAIERAQKKKALARFYNVSSILGNDWALFYIIIGSRMTGKSYSVTEFLCQQHKNYEEKCKNYWLRISETSTKAMLANKANKLVDPDLVRKYDLQLTTKGQDVFDHSKPFMTVIPLSQFAKLKGVAYFDKDFDGYYNIVLDEFQLEQGEKRTSFDVLYNLIGVLENIARTVKSKIRVFFIANMLEEAGSVLKAFNFIPHEFGRFYLKSKRCVIDNLEPTKEYLEDRKGSIADILGGNNMSNYTNSLERDRSMLWKGKLNRPTSLIKFSKKSKDWYTVFDGKVIRRYRGEGVKKENHINMFPYLDGYYSRERRQAIIDLYDSMALYFDSLITQAYFSEQLKSLRK